MSKCNEKTKIE